MYVAYFTPHRLQDSQVQDHWWVQKLHWGTATGGHPRMFWSSPQRWHYVSLGRETSLKGCPLLVPHTVFVFTPTLVLRKSWWRNPTLFSFSSQCWCYVSLGRETSLKGCPLLIPHIVFIFTPMLVLCKSWYRNYMGVLLLVGSPEFFGLIHPNALLSWYRN